MPFAFDTGAPQRPRAYAMGDAITGIMDAVKDSLPEDAAQEQIDAAFCLYLAGWLREPKTSPTVFQRFLSAGPQLAEILERDPALIIGVVLELAEQVDRLPVKPRRGDRG